MRWLIRHPKPDIAPGICYGQTDISLPSNWQQSCEYLLNDPVLREENVEIVSSPLQRCRLLAEWIGDHLNHRVTLDDRLQEMNFGAWEGQAWDDIADPNLERWMSNYQMTAVTDGESWPLLLERVQSFLKERNTKQGSQVLITHAGVIRAIQHLEMGLSADEVFAQSVPYQTLIPIRKKTTE